jgi:hypothetical protein
MVDIINNNEKELDEFHEEYYGATHISLDKEELQALLDGKCLAFSVQGEYSVTIELKGETK